MAATQEALYGELDLYGAPRFDDELVRAEGEMWPEVLIDLIDRPNEVPWGAGEPTTAVVPSAIANAVFDATGARLRSIPFRPAQVLAALNLAKPG